MFAQETTSGGGETTPSMENNQSKTEEVIFSFQPKVLLHMERILNNGPIMADNQCYLYRYSNKMKAGGEILLKKVVMLVTFITVFISLVFNLPVSATCSTGFNPNAYYRICNKASGKYLDNGGYTTNGSYEYQWSSTGSNNQQWKIIASDAGYYRIICRTGGLAVDNYGYTTDGANIQSYALGSSYNQQWQIVSQGDGYYKIINRTSGKCLDTGGLTSDGSILQQWGSGSSNNQLWTITEYTSSSYNNPVLWGAYGDPDIHCFNSQYYIYPTTDGYSGWNATSFKCFSSTDLVNWTDSGVILDLANVAWTTQNYAWAPSVIQKGSTYYMYYCANSNIGVATSSSPTGPFTDALGQALITQKQYISANTIDPCAFIDDDGQAYLYYGNTYCGVVKLNADMTSLNGTPVDITPTSFQEASCVIKRNSIYYLFYSLNGTTSKNYQVCVATSTSPMGPFTKQSTNPILSQNSSLGIVCTGSCSVMKIPSRDEWYIAYHRFIIPGGDGYHREVCIDRLYFNSDGSVEVVTPTLAGITSAVSP